MELIEKVGPPLKKKKVDTVMDGAAMLDELESEQRKYGIKMQEVDVKSLKRLVQNLERKVCDIVVC